MFHIHNKKYVRHEYGISSFEGYWICACGKSGIDETSDWKSLGLTEEQACEIMEHGRLI